MVFIKVGTMKVNLKEVDEFISHAISKLHDLDVDQLASLATNSLEFVALIEQWYDIKIEIVSDDVGNINWLLPQRDFEVMILKHL